MECFCVFRKEIKKLYKKNYDDQATKFDSHWINEGKQKLQNFEVIKKYNFEKALKIVIDYYEKNKLYDEE